MALATIITSPWPAHGTHSGLKVLVHVGSHGGWIRPAVDVIAVEELMLVVEQGLLRQAVLVGHHLIPTPRSSSGRGAMVAEGVQGSAGLGASVVDAGGLVVHLVVLGRERQAEAWCCPGQGWGWLRDGDEDGGQGTHQSRAGDQCVLLQLQVHGTSEPSHTPLLFLVQGWGRPPNIPKRCH